ncbi:MAG: type I restriction enzyme R subunit, partial [Clostridium sp.]
MRMFGEQIIDLVLAALKVDVDKYASQDDKIKLLRNTGINKAIPDLFDIVRRIGNKANHIIYEDKEKALECLVSMYRVSTWFYIKITKDTSIKPLKYLIQKSVTKNVSTYGIEEYQKEKDENKTKHVEEVSTVKIEVSK